MNDVNVFLEGKNKVGIKFVLNNGNDYVIKSKIRGKNMSFMIVVMSIKTGVIRLINVDDDIRFFVKFM